VVKKLKDKNVDDTEKNQGTVLIKYILNILEKNIDER